MIDTKDSSSASGEDKRAFQTCLLSCSHLLTHVIPSHPVFSCFSRSLSPTGRTGSEYSSRHKALCLRSGPFVLKQEGITVIRLMTGPKQRLDESSERNQWSLTRV